MVISQTVTIPKTVRWDADARAYVTDVPARDETIRIEIDVQGLLVFLGKKAANAKGRRAQVLHGLVKVRAL